MPHPAPRFYICARCGALSFICSSCDRGQLYCGRACSATARAESLRRAGRRHRQTRQGRIANAARQAAFRERRAEKVTHQGPPEPPPGATVEAAADEITRARGAAIEIACVCCGSQSAKGFVRLDFIRRRGRLDPRPPGLVRSSHDPPA